jgi:phosphotransacetylase
MTVMLLQHWALSVDGAVVLGDLGYVSAPLAEVMADEAQTAAHYTERWRTTP